MSRLIKIIKVTEDTCVACANYEGVGLGSMILNTTGKSRSIIERDFLQRFNSQLVQKRGGVKVGRTVSRYEYTIEWYRFDEIVKAKPSYMKEVVEDKKKLYIIDVDANGKPSVKEADHLFTEEEVKVELLKLATRA